MQVTVHYNVRTHIWGMCELYVLYAVRTVSFLMMTGQERTWTPSKNGSRADSIGIPPWRESQG